ncbi:MAG: response regulator [Eubacterium sp.]|nr:response regulator [Eubacterium sp.]
MPDLNGIETVRRIRKVIGDSTPIIILTAYDWSDIETEAREAGVTAFCQKPLFMSELRNVMAQPYDVPEIMKTLKEILG